ncbi:xanthine dehydrogenase family protein subunit M [Actinoplanes sp. NPDC048796]|uniref:FAD binding domain-containing protein n=1 Tax=Actinoplanes sp. NPDC048796 TaxID=3155640 RepID=UPI0034067076
MLPFTYFRPRTLDEAIEALRAGGESTKLLAGGTTLYDMMKIGVEAPAAVVDIHLLRELDHLEVRAGELVIGAGARMSAVSAHPEVRRLFPAVSESLWRSASQQLRNMATIGGNLMQRTRCAYFRGGVPYPCNKRDPGTGCAARDGVDGGMAVLGTSDDCIATYPGDLAVALVAFDAVVDVLGPDGARSLPVAQLRPLPGDTPHVEHVLRPGEVITQVRLPITAVAAKSAYLKIRPRESYAFAFASAAVGLVLAGSPAEAAVIECRIALGGVSTVPWRAAAAEQWLIGRPLTEDAARTAGEIAMRGAEPGRANAFKVELGVHTVAQSLLSLSRSES